MARRVGFGPRSIEAVSDCICILVYSFLHMCFGNPFAVIVFMQFSKGKEKQVNLYTPPKYSNHGHAPTHPTENPATINAITDDRCI